MTENWKPDLLEHLLLSKLSVFFLEYDIVFAYMLDVFYVPSRTECGFIRFAIHCIRTLNVTSKEVLSEILVRTELIESSKMKLLENVNDYHKSHSFATNITSKFMNKLETEHSSCANLQAAHSPTCCDLRPKILLVIGIPSVGWSSSICRWSWIWGLDYDSKHLEIWGIFL